VSLNDVSYTTQDTSPATTTPPLLLITRIPLHYMVNLAQVPEEVYTFTVLHCSTHFGMI